MWIKTEEGYLLNLDRVTRIFIFELDRSRTVHEDRPWSLVWMGDAGSGAISRFATKEDAETELERMGRALVKETET